MSESVGGGAFNVAANLSRLSTKLTFISPRAKDSNADKVTSEINKHDTIHDLPVYIAGRTPSYTAMLDQNGEMISAIADMTLYDEISAKALVSNAIITELQQCDILITDANFPSDVFTEISAHLPETSKWYAIATSPAKVVRYSPVLNKLELLAMNKNEAKAILNKDITSTPETLHKEFKALGLSGAIITNGQKPVIYYSKYQETSSMLVPKLEDIKDVTGAGDALLSGFIWATNQKADMKKAIEYGIRAAHITLMSEGAQNPKLSVESINRALPL